MVRHCPQLHGEFMHAAYESSPVLGQLAVSYVLRHYGGQLPQPPLPELPHAAVRRNLLLTADGATAGEIARSNGVSPVTVKNYRTVAISTWHAGNLSGAVRLGIEADVIPFEQIEGYGDGFDPADLMIFDLHARGQTSQRIKRLTGYSRDSITRRQTRLLSQLGTSLKRKSLGVVRLYQYGIFRKGLLYDLDAYPDRIKEFDAGLGRNAPLL